MITVVEQAGFVAKDFIAGSTAATAESLGSFGYGVTGSAVRVLAATGLPAVGDVLDETPQYRANTYFASTVSYHSLFSATLNTLRMGIVEAGFNGMCTGAGIGSLANTTRTVGATNAAVGAVAGVALATAVGAATPALVVAGVVGGLVGSVALASGLVEPKTFVMGATLTATMAMSATAGVGCRPLAVVGDELAKMAIVGGVSGVVGGLIERSWRALT